jgi:hypothetical protein
MVEYALRTSSHALGELDVFALTTRFPMIATPGSPLCTAASADPAQVKDVRDRAYRLLDRMLPAWMSATVSQLAPGQPGTGFILGVSYLSLTAL